MRIIHFAAALVALTFSVEAFAAANVGEAAPIFTGKTAAGTDFNLADQKGKIVVLEWTNRGCPFVQKFYAPGEMQKLQKEATAQDVVWVSVLSSAEGKQGQLDAEEALAHAKEVDAAPSHIVLDAEGTIGKLYGAKTTPHMFVIGTDGALEYAGAIDSIASANPADIEKADNYVVQAIAALQKGETPQTTSAKPYGCGVKYNY